MSAFKEGGAFIAVEFKDSLKLYKYNISNCVELRIDH